MKKALQAATLAAALPLAIGSSIAHADECGTVQIADMGWNSASLIANIDRFVLEHGFGCDASLVPGDTMPTGTSMVEKGEPDIAPEMWSNSLKEALDRGVAEGRLIYAGHSLSDGGEEGFWVPSYMVEKYPELATIEGVKAHAELFEHPEDPDVSAFYGCPAGWNCQISSSNLFHAMELDKSGFKIVDPGSGAGLAGSLAKAYERGEAWFGYYWAPTSIMGRYDMVKVDFGSGVDEDAFVNCVTDIECTDPVVTMYPPSPVQTVTTTDFAQRAPEAFQYLSKRSLTNDQMNSLLAWMEDNQADGEYAAEYFLLEHEDIWSQWLPAEVVAQVKDAL